MKLKSLIYQQSKLIQLQLIKSKMYKTNSESIESIELHLKKALQIVHKYHVNSKQIFFVGLSNTIQSYYQKVLKNTKHLSVPQSTWVNGILSNRVSILKYLHQKINSNSENNKANLKYLFSIQQKPDLIVLFNKELELDVFQEATKLKIPVISVTTKCNLDQNSLYSIYGTRDAIEKRVDNLYLILLNSILKNESKIKSS